MKNIQQTAALLLSIVILTISCNKPPEIASTTPQGKKEALGKKIFFDKNLSNSIGQSCSSCHAEVNSFTDPEHNIVSPGATSGLFGNRNAPMVSYAKYTPPFRFNTTDLSFEGGLFLDGRINTLEDQAKKPFLNPLEMNNIDGNAVVEKIKASSYYNDYVNIYGEVSDYAQAFDNVANAISAYEQSSELNPFSSKFDAYLKGKATFTAQELNGYKLFTDTIKAKCANCHLATLDENSNEILFTDFTYNNDGVPKNPYNPYYTIPSSFNPYGENYIDLGLGAILNDRNHDGEFKVPSLRNVALTAPYFHNGVFSSLEEVVHFYNVRDVQGSGIASAEVNYNIDSLETGNQKLTPKEEADIVAYLKTLTDGFVK